MEGIKASNRQIALIAFDRLCREDKTDSALKLTRCMLRGTGISPSIGDIDWKVNGAIQQYEGVPRTGYRYTAYSHLNRNTEMAKEVYDEIVRELYGQGTTRRRLKGHFRHLQRYVWEEESCHIQITEIDEQKILILDFTKSLMGPVYTLVWADYNDSLDNHCRLIQKCLDNKSRGHLWEKADEWYSDAEWETVREITAKLKKERAVFHDSDGEAVDDFFDEYEDEIRDEIYSHNNSGVVRGLVRHTDDTPIRVEVPSSYDRINSNRFESQSGCRHEESYFGDMVDGFNPNPARVKEILTEHGYRTYGRFPNRKNRNDKEQVSYEQFYEEPTSSCCEVNLLAYIGRVNPRELYEADFSLEEVIIPKGNCCGLFDSTYGGGSLLEMELKRDVKLKLEVKDYRSSHFRLDDERLKYDCSARYVYRVDDSFFGDAVRIVS